MSARHFYTRRQIEAKAEDRLRELEQHFGRALEPPVSIDTLIEHIFDLKISWEPIETRPGERAFGALRPQSRQLILNENELPIFSSKPGLERSTKGHELGHWDLFTDHASLGHPMLPGFDSAEHFVKRSTPKGEVELVRLLMTDPDAYTAYKEIQRGVDPPGVKSAVDFYASVLSMPGFLILPAMKPIHDNWQQWSAKTFNQQLRDLYDIAESFDVTISALKVRLEQLKLLYIPPDEKAVYRNKQEYHGQTTLL